MFIPLRTDRPPRRKPLITEGLIAVNLLVYLVGLIGQSFDRFDLESMVNGGHFDPQHFVWWQLITSQFLHDPHGVLHIAFNMLFLWVFGAAVEDRLGRIGFLGFYLIGGSVACLAHAMVSPAPVIGASGAIAAVTGAFLALYPHSRIIVLFLIGMTAIAIPSLWFIGFYMIVDLLRQAGVVLGAHGSNVAYMAHIAGYAYGFGTAFLLLALRILKRDDFDMFFLFTQSRRRAALRAANRNTPAGAWDNATADTAKRLEKAAQKPLSTSEKRTMELRAEINRLAADHNLADAAAKYKSMLRESPDTVFTESRQLELANQLYSTADHATAAAAYELFLDRYPRSGHSAEVRLILGVLYTRQLNHPARAREVIDAAKPALHDPRQSKLADELLGELTG